MWGRDGSNDPSIYLVSEVTSPVGATFEARDINDTTALGLDPGTMPLIIKTKNKAHTQTHTQS